MKKQIGALMMMGLAGGALAQFEIGGKAGLNYHFQSISLGDRAPAGATAPEGNNGLGYHFGGSWCWASMTTSTSGPRSFTAPEVPQRM